MSTSFFRQTTQAQAAGPPVAPVDPWAAEESAILAGLPFGRIYPQAVVSWADKAQAAFTFALQAA